VFGLGPATRIYLAVGSTDMRKGFEGLYGLVRYQLGLDPLSGHLCIFCNKERNRLKILFWDGSGLWVCAKRLEKGRFSWPMQCSEQGRVALSHEELALLLGGIDLRRTQRKNWYRKEGLFSKKVEENAGV
jgi:transposase